jgi:endonuclease YncB( thermonuclease family)
MENLTFSDVDLFTFEGLQCKAKVVKILDGDTVHVLIEYNNKIIRLVCRLFGIDTPEMSKTPESAKRARNRLLQLCTNCNIALDDMMDSKVLNTMIKCNTLLINVEFMGKEKYGRELVNLYSENNECINELLIKENYAYSYTGGKKLH